MIVFGYVPSRRLGRSLGVNNLPKKFCTYSCVYCQIGRTTNLIVERREFYDPNQIYQEVDNALKSLGDEVDYITFVPNGEPTLDVNFGKTAEMLKDFPMYESDAKELEEKAKTLVEFHRMLATKDLKLIDKFVKEHPFLEDVNDYQILEKEWREKLEQAEIYASKGDIENTLESLKDYIDIEDKRIKIGQLIRSAYLQQILSLLAKRFKGEKIEDILFENAFKNYIRLFGFDIEISDLIEKAKKLKIDVNVSGISEGDLTRWHIYKLPAKIWEELGVAIENEK